MQITNNSPSFGSKVVANTLLEKAFIDLENNIYGSKTKKMTDSFCKSLNTILNDNRNETFEVIQRDIKNEGKSYTLSLIRYTPSYEKSKNPDMAGLMTHSMCSDNTGNNMTDFMTRLLSRYALKLNPKLNLSPIFPPKTSTLQNNLRTLKLEIFGNKINA